MTRVPDAREVVSDLGSQKPASLTSGDFGAVHKKCCPSGLHRTVFRSIKLFGLIADLCLLKKQIFNDKSPKSLQAGGNSEKYDAEDAANAGASAYTKNVIIIYNAILDMVTLVWTYYLNNMTLSALVGRAFKSTKRFFLSCTIAARLRHLATCI